MRATLETFAKQLQEKGVKNPWRELRQLMAHVTGESYEAYFFETGQDLTSEQLSNLKKLLDRRLQMEPLSKIIGRREFWGLDFKITQDTLDPRADSETLVQAVVDQFSDSTKSLRIIDFGTGSGCLLISLLKEFPNALGFGIDRSKASIKIAHENALALGLADRTFFCVSDWAQPLQGQFDVIISNPPYIGVNEPLELNVKNYDPASALFAGEDGLDAYRALFGQIGKLCHSQTHLFFEIGKGQKEAVSEIASLCQFSLVDAYPDLGGIERVLEFQLSRFMT